MTIYKQFIVYKVVPSESRPGKTDKFPCCYRTGRVKVDSQDSQFWTDANTAVETAEKWGSEYGVGFVLTESDPFWFLDIDGGLVNGAWSAITVEMFERFPACAKEVSGSNTGAHIFGLGNVPEHKKTNKARGLEFYSSGRFVALTGTLAVGDCCVDATAAVADLVATYFKPDLVVSQPLTDGPRPDWNGPTDDAELIRRAIRGKGAAAAFGGEDKANFEDCWTLNIPVLSKAYPDPKGVDPYDASALDMAVAFRLAFWTGCDRDRIERIMRSNTKLYREKWDNHATYLRELTIRKACELQDEVLQDKRPGALSPALTVPSGTPDELTHEDFYAHLPTHSYINRRTREFLSVDAVNGHLRRFTDSLGMKPAAWLDVFRAVQQMSWQPSHPEIIEGMVSINGHLQPDPKGRIYNLYRASDAVASDADASPWVNHVRSLYPEGADHIMKYCAYRIQNPGEKINHALVIGGSQGIGKDLILEPLRYGVGRSNSADVNPGDLFKDFTPWVECTLLIINEARDLGDVDRYKFYESSKRFIAAPPDTLPCNRKYLASYDVPNVMAVVITSNNKLSGLYIEPDDRRHYVAWSTAEKQPSSYFDRLWNWLQDGGKQAVLGYLQRLDIADFNPKAEPPKTEAWRQIVAAHANPEETALSDALEDEQGNRIQIATVREIIAAAQFGGQVELAAMLMDRKNARKIPHLLERIGLETLPNPYAKDGRWRLGDGKKETLYIDRKLPYAERLKLANQKSLVALVAVGKSSIPVVQ